MAAQHHYVSRFHLKQFLDPDSLASRDPWLWQGFVADGRVKRRAPTNVGTVRLLFDRPGGLADRDATIEQFLANEVEGPAAEAMRDVATWAPGSARSVPPELTRYLAWAAARSLPMQALEQRWAEEGLGRTDEVVEPPPDGLLNTTYVQRDVAMRHPTLGRRTVHAGGAEEAMTQGWVLDMSERANFLEAIHIQAYYFQVRFFPRFKWFSLHAPKDESFVLADRAVGWAADGIMDAPPSCLRHPSAYVLAPISRRLVLVGRHSTEAWRITASQVNALVAHWAHEWIVGSDEATVKSAIEVRRNGEE